MAPACSWDPTLGAGVAGGYACSDPAARAERRTSRSRDLKDAQARGAAPRGRRAVLADQDPGSDEPVRMGEPVRRVRPVLPDEARGRGYRRGPPHGCRLHAPRRAHLPLPRLSAPSEAGARLRPFDTRGGAHDPVAAADLRLPSRPGRRAALPVASPDLGTGSERA